MKYITLIYQGPALERQPGTSSHGTAGMTALGTRAHGRPFPARQTITPVSRLPSPTGKIHSSTATTTPTSTTSSRSWTQVREPCGG